jgi:hypothetical protein
MENQGGGFVVRDRRGRGDESAATASGAAPGGRVDAPPSAHAADSSAEPRPEVTFSSFVFSLGTSALMLMGEQLDPRQPAMPVNLSQAKEIIDILSVLEAKTKGNLSSEEQSVLTDMLYALRMKYVDLASGKHPAPAS